MLNAFHEWYQLHREALEVAGMRLQFWAETEEQTVKSNSLNVTFGRYDGCVYVWERGDGNIELVDREADVSTLPKDCADFIELQFDGPADLDNALSSFFEMLTKLPHRNVPAGTALRLYQQGLTAGTQP